MDKHTAFRHALGVAATGESPDITLDRAERFMKFFAPASPVAMQVSLAKATETVGDRLRSEEAQCDPPPRLGLGLKVRPENKDVTAGPVPEFGSESLSQFPQSEDGAQPV